MQSIAIKIFVHGCQAGKSEGIRGGGGGQRPFQDLFQIQLHKHLLDNRTVSANRARCLDTSTSTVKFSGTTLVFLHRSPLSCSVALSVGGTHHFLSLLVLSGLVGSSKKLKEERCLWVVIILYDHYLKDYVGNQ